MRYFAYGILATAAISAAPKPACPQSNLLTRLNNGVTERALVRRILGIIDSGLFIPTGGPISPFQKWVGKRVEKTKRLREHACTCVRVIGFLFCVAIALFTTLLILVLVGLVMLEWYVWLVLVVSVVSMVIVVCAGYVCPHDDLPQVEATCSQ